VAGNINFPRYATHDLTQQYINNTDIYILSIKYQQNQRIYRIATRLNNEYSSFHHHAHVTQPAFKQMTLKINKYHTITVSVASDNKKEQK